MSDITEINAVTGEIIIREYTNEEIEYRSNIQKPENLLIDEEALSNYLANKQTALLKLQSLGLTEDEAKAIIGI